MGGRGPQAAPRLPWRLLFPAILLHTHVSVLFFGNHDGERELDESSLTEASCSVVLKWLCTLSFSCRCYGFGINKAGHSLLGLGILDLGGLETL